MIDIPQSYFLTKFHQYGYKVSKNGNDYISCCPYCREGKSWGRRKRLYYLVSENYLHCHNCSNSWKPYWWLREIAGMEYSEILDELKETGSYEDGIFFERIEEPEFRQQKSTVILPEDSINLLDPIQETYYKNDKFYQLAHKFLKKRRLLTAKYRPSAYYLSKEDTMHKNRLIIPYYNVEREICYYQSRALTPEDEEKGKYFFKLNSEHKEVFNVDKVNVDLDYIYMFEGALDCMFVENGISGGGVHFTSYQLELVNRSFPFQEIVYVLDNPKFDQTVDDKLEKLIEEGKKVFLWGGEFASFKDFSQMTEKNKIDYIPNSEIDKYLYSGKEAMQVFQKIKLHRK